jgi:hypothetical protein
MSLDLKTLLIFGEVPYYAIQLTKLHNYFRGAYFQDTISVTRKFNFHRCRVVCCYNVELAAWRYGRAYSINPLKPIG